ncbi:BnaA03g53650D [Brassica napus]|uniref:(rape) hypothetical protein n=1 Tax=Brassica napus TaxID=3708 RepID=A0A078HXW2_BRANA|nr:unnamed protein product [Brassica napus]CDY42712.1 BnaA03g53650D [Brassica napus]
MCGDRHSGSCLPGCRKETPIIPAIWVWIGSGDDLGDVHPAPTPTRYPRSSYPSPTIGRGR